MFVKMCLRFMRSAFLGGMAPLIQNSSRATVIKALTTAAGGAEVLRASDYLSWLETHDGPDLPAVHRAFPKGWASACRAAGLREGGMNGPAYSLKAARAALRKVKREWGRRPIGYSDYLALMKSDPEYVSIRAFIYYWGSWSQACVANGLIPKHRRYSVRFSDDDPVLKEARSRLPSTFREFNRSRPPGAPFAQTWARRAGGWVAFQLAQGIPADEIQQVQISSRTGSR